MPVPFGNSKKEYKEIQFTIQKPGTTKMAIKFQTECLIRSVEDVFIVGKIKPISPNMGK